MHSGLMQLRIILRWKTLATLVTRVEKGVGIVYCFYVVPHMCLSIVAKLVAKPTVVLFGPIK